MSITPLFSSLVDTKEKRKGAIAALLFMLMVLIMLFLNTFSIPDPPLEEELVEIGIEGDFAGGSSSSSNSNPNNTTESVTTPPAQEIETQDDESVYVPSDEGQTDTQEETQQNTNTSQQEERQPDSQWNFGNFGNGNGEGEGTGEGDKFGDGDGDGGNGGQSGSGDGGYNPGRKKISDACIDVNSQIEGTIALDIWVDENGKVVRTQYNESKSNTGNQNLIRLAEKATRCMKYEEKPGTGTQKVKTAVFRFKKQ